MADSYSFDLLHPEVQRWVYEQRWSALRDVQEQAIPAILRGDKDVILAAATASGKTEAAFLPIVTKITEREITGLSVVYIAPLKALINDQFQRLELLCERLEIPVHRWHGDVDAGRKRGLLKNPTGILLITPESLEALFLRHGTRLSSIFADVEYVIVDELHAFLASERGRQLQCLLYRLEDVLKRRVPRIALSATLADLRAAAEFLRPGHGPETTIIQSNSESVELRVQLRGYRVAIPKPDRLGIIGAESLETSLPEKFVDSNDDTDASEDETPSIRDAIFHDRMAVAEHLFETLRNGHHLIFANARIEVEAFTDLFATLSEKARVPNPFFPHHGSLSREIREETESRLKDNSRPAVAVCTSTLEMGIDIGAMESVAQIGAPPSVSSLRQRLGRSGRRDEPARLRLYSREIEMAESIPVQDMLRCGTFEMIAMMHLMLDGYNEPSRPDCFHFSTLTQQALSLLAQYGGMPAQRLWKMLCKEGPFRAVDSATFGAFLRALHTHDLVQQMNDGTLLVGLQGERLINNYTFYAAFNTPDEYRLISEGKPLGTLPIENALLPDSYLVYAGRRWRVLAVDTAQKVVDLVPASGGSPPIFGGHGVWVEADVRRRMRAFYQSSEIPAWLDRTAKEFVAEGRETFLNFELGSRRIVPNGMGTLLFLWTSDRVAQTISLALHVDRLRPQGDGVCLSIDDVRPDDVRESLHRFHIVGLPPELSLAAYVPNKASEKHDPYLTEDLLNLEYATRFLDIDGADAALHQIAMDGEFS